MIAWLARLRPEHKTETSALEQAAYFISSLRCFLHYHFGRDRNVLNFEAQEKIVEQAFTRVKTPAAWMREYFKNARVIFSEARRTLDVCERSDSSLLGSFRDWRTRLSNADFTVSRERVFLRNPALLASDPGVVFRLLEFIGRHGVPPSAETERRRLEAARDLLPLLRASPQPLWPALKSRPVAAARAPWRCERCGNTALLPSSSRSGSIVTGGDGLLSPLRWMSTRWSPSSARAALRDTKDSTLGALRVCSEIDNPAVLLFALLFHDVVKEPTRVSTRVSVELAKQAMALMPQTTRPRSRARSSF